MTTLPPPVNSKAPEDSLEHQVYSIVEKYSKNIPIANDRNRLAFNLFNYMNGQGDPPHIVLESAKIKIEGIGKDELVELLDYQLKSLK